MPRSLECFTGPDRRSRMPSYNEVPTVQDLIDLIAYLNGLTVGGHRRGGH